MVWLDQGLYFSLGLNGIGVVVCVVVAYIMHRQRRLARLLRPNLPGSKMSTFFTAPRSLLCHDEDEVAKTNGVYNALYLLMLKWQLRIFVAGIAPALVLICLNVTDSYLNDYAMANDPKECADKGISDCGDSPFCHAVLDVVTGNETCAPMAREGLFDLGMENVTPKNWRMYVIGVVNMLFSCAIAACFYFLTQHTVRLIRASYLKPWNKHVRYGALGSIGARTVLVKGLGTSDEALESNEEFLRQFIHKEGRKERTGIGAGLAKVATAPLGFVRDRIGGGGSPVSPASPQPQLDMTESPAAAPLDGTASEQPESATSKALGTFKSVMAEPFVGEVGGFDSTGDDVCQLRMRDLGRDVIPDSVNVIYEEPDEMLDLLDDEATAIADLTEAIAEEQEADSDEERPLMKRPRPVVCFCQGKVPAVEYEKDELEAIRVQLREKVKEVNSMPPLGYAFFTFNRPSKAWAYAARFRSTLASAQIVGPREHVHWHNLAANKWVLRLRWAFVVSVFAALLLFWTIPVAFLGSLENLAGLPGIGGAFSSLVDWLGPEWTGILQANLPAVVIAGFNVLLPILLRVFAHISGVLNLAQEEGTILWMYWLFTFLSAAVFQAVLQGGVSQLAAVISNSDKDAWFALIVAIMSPQGGYWGALVLLSGMLIMSLQLLQPAPVALFAIFRVRVRFQEAYDALFDPRDLETSVWAAKHLLIFAVCMLFHTTLPLLVVFGLVYFLNAYLVFRSLVLDSGEPCRTMYTSLSMFKSYLHIMAFVYNFASFGTLIVCVVKEGWGAVAFTSIGCAVSVCTHVYVAVTMRRIVTPPVKVIAELDKELESLEPLEEITAPYMPDYFGYNVDEGLVARLEAATYTLDTTLTDTWTELPTTAEVGGNDPHPPLRAKPNGECFQLRPERNPRAPAQPGGVTGFLSKGLNKGFSKGTRLLSPLTQLAGAAINPKSKQERYKAGDTPEEAPPLASQEPTKSPEGQEEREGHEEREGQETGEGVLARDPSRDHSEASAQPPPAAPSSDHAEDSL